MKRHLITGLCASLLVSAAIAAGTSIAYRGNVKSKIFHHTSCRYFNSKNCTATFETRSAAVNAGYRGCEVCKPQ